MSEIEDMIQFVMDDNFNKANDVFKNAIGDKVADALEQEKIGLAADIFNGGRVVQPEEEELEGDEIVVSGEEDDEDFEITDEDLENIDFDDIEDED